MGHQSDPGQLRLATMNDMTLPSPPLPMIVGVPRSGTTLLRLMLDAHPQLAIPPETGFLLAAPHPNPQATPRELAGHLLKHPVDAPAWADFGVDAGHFLAAASHLPLQAGLAEVLRLFYRLYAERHNKPRYGDKTPLYVEHIQRVAQHLPEARFIHILRDGRDVALSWRKVWFAPSQDMPELVRRWARMIHSARQQARGLHYLEVHYDQLLRTPERQLRRICDFIELDFNPCMLDFHRHAPERLAEHRARYHVDGHLLVSQEQRLQQQRLTMQPLDESRLAVWRELMSPAEQIACEGAAAGLLREFSDLDD